MITHMSVTLLRDYSAALTCRVNAMTSLVDSKYTVLVGTSNFTEHMSSNGVSHNIMNIFIELSGLA